MNELLFYVWCAQIQHPRKVREEVEQQQLACRTPGVSKCHEYWECLCGQQTGVWCTARKCSTISQQSATKCRAGRPQQQSRTVVVACMQIATCVSSYMLCQSLLALGLTHLCSPCSQTSTRACTARAAKSTSPAALSTTGSAL
jgi:hypothetical protein